MQTETTRTGLKVGIVRAAVEHVPQLYAQIDKSREHLKPLVWSKTIDEAGVRRHVESIDWKHKALWTVMVNGAPAGCIEFRQHDENFMELGYWLSKDYARQGVMSKALGIGLMTLWIGCRVSAHIRDSNHASRGVLLKNGFVPISCDELGGEPWVTFERIVGYKTWWPQEAA